MSSTLIYSTEEVSRETFFNERGSSSSGRAFGSQSKGSGFESHLLHNKGESPWRFFFIAGWHRFCWNEGMEKMIFTTDRTSLTEGEVITINWDCKSAERTELTIDNGYKATIIPLEVTGEKRFRLNRSKGRTRLTITAWVNGKDYSKTIKVKVTELPLTHAETVDSKGRTIGKPQQWLGGLRDRWRKFTDQYRSNWQAMPPKKQLATRLLMIIAGVMLVSAISPLLMSLGMLVLIGYLLLVIWKK